MKKQIIQFLINNGFTMIDTDKYGNSECSVIIERNRIGVQFNNGNNIWHKSNDLSAYLWLLGAFYQYSLTQYNPKVILSPAAKNSYKNNIIK